VVAAVDLDELAVAVAPVPRLVGLLETLAPGRPEAGCRKLLAEGFAPDADVVQLEELLVGERGAEVGVPLADDADGTVAARPALHTRVR
jgi:hypothetical protein